MRFDRENSNRRQSSNEAHLIGAKVGESKKRTFISFSLLLVTLTAALIPQLSMAAWAGHHGGGGGGGRGGGGGGQARQAARAVRVQQRASFRQPKAARMPRVARQPNFARQPKPAKQARRIAFLQRGTERHAAKNVKQNSRATSKQFRRQAVVQKHVNKKVQKNVIANVNRNAKVVRKQNQAASKATARANKFIAHAQPRNFRVDKRLTNQQIRNSNKFQKAVIKAGRWDAKLDNKARYRTYRNYRKNWTAQRSYLNANLARFNQLAAINQAQQIQLDNQMRAAYLAYQPNYNGAYNWNVYSNPQFLDYLQYRKPSLLQQILSALGLGYGDDYLYSPSWEYERTQLAQNFGNIHQYALAGRITPMQEQILMNQMRPEYLAYNNQFNGVPTWSQYSDPGFVDYLHTRKPGILTTIRDYLIR